MFAETDPNVGKLDALLAAQGIKQDEITYGLDIDPQQAIKTRRDLLIHLAESGTPLAATHLSYPGMGHVTQDGDGFIFKPLS
ncbi:hypothetical protein SAMN04488518_11981 [Pseudovibrio ascidiaceicola]|uniref:Uncharacterized protein n=1 Tax=Pseudovibrio ascidiaceicola TaxID=285279 RepID=A0A1I4FKP7_9HYPH|nr:hypothetical protein SAMN04488518_11981 [Pseudovibrio ascidiaceicola]